MRSCTMGLVAAASLASMLPPPASADGEDSGSKRCLSLSSIRETDVVDDQSVLFYMRNGSIYLNHLSHACPRLGLEKRFMYATSVNQLCTVDTITVLEDWGFGLERGATCGLGQFTPVSKSAAKDLKAGPHESLFKTQRVPPVKQQDKQATGPDPSNSTDEGKHRHKRERD